MEKDMRGQAGRAAVGTFLIVAIVLAALVFGWHLWSTEAVRTGATEFVADKLPGVEVVSVSVEPVTNVVSITVRTKGAGAAEDPLSVLGEALSSALGTALASAFEPAVEREVNLRAREDLDVYAMLLPYRVRLTRGEGA